MISQKFQIEECNACVAPASRLKPAGFALNSRAFDARSRRKFLSRGLGAAVYLLCACCSSHAALPAGWTEPHRTSHLNGTMPVGGNLGMLDGHVEWRRFQQMRVRNTAFPFFFGLPAVFNLPRRNLNYFGGLCRQVTRAGDGGNTLVKLSKYKSGNAKCRQQLAGFAAARHQRRFDVLPADEMMHRDCDAPHRKLT
jgi:prepilin-type processing-associated H-X9-DG protein